MVLLDHHCAIPIAITHSNNNALFDHIKNIDKFGRNRNEGKRTPLMVQSGVKTVIENYKDRVFIIKIPELSQYIKNLPLQARRDRQQKLF